jgi:amidohydrolase
MSMKQLAIGIFVSSASLTQAAEINTRVDRELDVLAPRIIEWRRDFHENAELSNREFRTAKIVAEHLKRLGLEVQTGVAKTGVLGLLKGGKPGATIALRADMDGLPVIEQTDVPFKSKRTDTYNGNPVGVMHACGHDAHTSILMGIAEALTKVRADLPGNVLFIFQPAEEGPPAGEEGGAPLMLKEGVFDKYKPEVAFGLHVTSNLRVGQIGYRGGPLMAASDAYRIVVKGVQTHGARPWGGVDPIVTSAQIINALQTIVSRTVDITKNPAVVTVGMIKGGVRNNIVPDEVEMVGTIRTFDPQQRADVMMRMKRIVENVSAANGATGSFELMSVGNPVTYNNPELTSLVVPSLKRSAGDANVIGIPLETGAEDFAYFAQKVPSFFFFVGITPKDKSPAMVPVNHSPLFFIDESGIPVGTHAFAQLAVDYLQAKAQR